MATELLLSRRHHHLYATTKRQPTKQSTHRCPLRALRLQRCQPPPPDEPAFAPSLTGESPLASRLQRLPHLVAINGTSSLSTGWEMKPNYSWIYQRNIDNRMGEVENEDADGLSQILQRWRKKAATTSRRRVPIDVPSGHVVITVGTNCKRYVVRATYLNHPIFKKFLSQAEEEYGFTNSGPLAIP
ncbi:putative GDSL esterase/lipase-like [Capsicum annuum]|nr:putative GDSL esterase/lipase-like [Capsicum annuum]